MVNLVRSTSVSIADFAKAKDQIASQCPGSGIDPMLVGERIDALKAECHETETALAGLDHRDAKVMPLNASTALRRFSIACCA
jgi:hypothetical protein